MQTWVQNPPLVTCMELRKFQALCFAVYLDNCQRIGRVCGVSCHFFSCLPTPMFVTAGQTRHRKPMDINIFSSSYLQRGNCAKQRAGRRRGGWRLKERIARSHLNNKWGEVSHFHFISTWNIFVSDCNGDGCEWWPARNVELSYIWWIQKVSLQSALIEVLLICSETSRWRQRLGSWMTFAKYLQPLQHPALQ